MSTENKSIQKEKINQHKKLTTLIRSILLFTSYYSPFTTHHSQLTIHYSPFTTHHSPLTIHHPPSTTLRSLLLSSIFFLLTSFLSSCNRSHQSDVSHIQVDLKLNRFEQELFQENADPGYLRSKYGEFFDFYFRQFGIQPSNSDSTATWKDSVIRYTRDPVLRALYDSVEIKFRDLSTVKNELENAFSYYHNYFPNGKIPEVITLINGPGPTAFTYGDSLLGIALDDYLGEKFSYYQYLEIPEYALRKFRQEYIVPNSAEVWINHEFPTTKAEKNLLDAMVYRGKTWYLKSRILPDTPDSLITGFKEKDLQWCKENEPEIWKFFIEHKLLYSVDPLEYSKYLNDGPRTSGMPDDAPGNIGSWVGWRIVSRYMEKNPSVTLPKLMVDPDAQKILTESRYKPTR